ncbi:lipid A deacylase LpxR family protein [Sulfurimonas sp.]
MKYLLNLLIMALLSSTLIAEDKDWILDRINIYTENDVFTGTDDSYSSGESFNFLFFIPEEDYMVYDLLGYSDVETYSYFTFALTNQIYTPTDVLATALIPTDRPYAGWSYLEGAMHKASKSELRSLSLQVGIVGPSSYSEEMQDIVHQVIDSSQVNGWGNQLKNELGVNLKYTQKWRYQSEGSDYFESSIIPFASAELGNIAINATAGFTTRIGWNIPKDFGVSSIDIGADPGIPVKGEFKNMKKLPWSFSFNIAAAGSAVARDIFLDGNTFKDSHSVDKKTFVGYYGFGFTTRYKNFVVDFMEVHNSKQFKGEKRSHAVGNLIVSWLF